MHIDDEVLDPQELLWLQGLTDGVHVDDELLDYIVAIASFTRDHGQVQLGASPRASLQLMYACRAKALLDGRSYVLPDDVKAMASHVFAHRLLLAPEAELDGVPQTGVVEEALKKVAYRPERRR